MFKNEYTNTTPEQHITKQRYRVICLNCRLLVGQRDSFNAGVGGWVDEIDNWPILSSESSFEGIGWRVLDVHLSRGVRTFVCMRVLMQSE